MLSKISYKIATLINYFRDYKKNPYESDKIKRLTKEN